MKEAIQDSCITLACFRCIQRSNATQLIISKDKSIIPRCVVMTLPYFCEISLLLHYTDVTMSPMASQITSLGIVYSTVYSGSDQRKHQSSASLAFVRRIHRGPVNSPQKWPVTQKMFSFDDVIMKRQIQCWVARAHCLIQSTIVTSY